MTAKQRRDDINYFPSPREQVAEAIEEIQRLYKQQQERDSNNQPIQVYGHIVPIGESERSLDSLDLLAEKQRQNQS